jgi:hypothetical protein
MTPNLEQPHSVDNISVCIVGKKNNPKNLVQETLFYDIQANQTASDSDLS